MSRAVDNYSQGVRIASPITVLWVTNMAAPYRKPVWRHLAVYHKLTVGLLESNIGLKNDRDANRGQDWLHDSDGEIIFTEFPTWKYSHGESRFYTLRNIQSALAIRRFDVILFGGWESPAYWALLVVCVAFGIPRVGFYESPANTMTHKSGPVAWMRSKFFCSMNVVVVPGEAAADAVLGLGVRKGRIMQGFNAVDVTEFHRASNKPNDDEQEASSSGHRYLYVGQLIERKRVDAIVDAFLVIAMPEDELTIVGTGPLLQRLNSAADGQAAKINFRGHVENDHMPMLMARHHTLILASHREVWGLVVNEALASGMHVVVTDNCGVSNSVRDMRGVYLADRNLVNLAEQMNLSRARWTGRIAAPEILQYTPARFAAVFERAFIASVGANRRNGAATNGKDERRT